MSYRPTLCKKKGEIVRRENVRGVICPDPVVMVASVLGGSRNCWSLQLHQATYFTFRIEIVQWTTFLPRELIPRKRTTIKSALSRVVLFNYPHRKSPPGVTPVGRLRSRQDPPRGWDRIRSTGQYQFSNFRFKNVATLREHGLPQGGDFLQGEGNLRAKYLRWVSPLINVM